MSFQVILAALPTKYNSLSLSDAQTYRCITLNMLPNRKLFSSIVMTWLKHGVWKSQKKSHWTLRAKRATFTFLNGQKFIKNCQKWSILASFWKPKICGQTVLPDRSVLIRQKVAGKRQKVQMRDFESFSNNVLEDEGRSGWELVN